MVNPRVFELPTARDNIFFDVVHQELMSDPVQHIQEFLQEKLSTGGSSIVYVRTKDQASSICRSLNQLNLSSTEYHRGLSEDTCKQNQQLWMSDEVQVMVATIAFGLGINKSNVRAIVHYGLPDDMAAYFQEAGRAGRDGLPAFSRIVLSEGDRRWKEGLMKSEGNKEKLKNFRELAETLYRTDTCRHHAFDKALESVEQRPNFCDGICDHCHNRAGLCNRSKALQYRSSYPFINAEAESDEGNVSSPGNNVLDDEVRDLFEEEASEEEEEQATEVEKPKRRFGVRSGDPPPEGGSFKIAEYFHTCGNCSQPNQDNIITHLTQQANHACLEAYSQGIFATGASDPIYQTLFDLALIMGACLNPLCRDPHYGRKQLRDHLTLTGNCLEYYLHFFRTYLQQDNMDRNKILGKAKSLMTKTKFRGSSNEEVPKEDQMRHKESARKARQRENDKRKAAVDPSLCNKNFTEAQAELLRVPCSLCQWQYTRRLQQQERSAINVLDLDVNNEVEEKLRGPMGGTKPEEHLKFDGMSWSCMRCRKQEPPTTKFDGNQQIYKVLQAPNMASLQAVNIDNPDEDETVVVLAPSTEPTMDVDGNAAKLPPNVNLLKSAVLLPADTSGVDNFKEDFPHLLLPNWKVLTKLAAKQSVLPGVFTLLNIIHACHRLQIQDAKAHATEARKTQVIAKTGPGHTLQVMDFDGQSADVEVCPNVGEPTDELEEGNTGFKGVCSTVPGTSDYFRATVVEERSITETYGAIRMQLKIKIFNGIIDGKIGSLMISPALVKVIKKTDAEGQCVDYDAFLRCTEDPIRGCDNGCQKQAHPNMDYVQGMQDPNFVWRRLPILARYISQTSENFINNFIRNRFPTYYFWFQYDKDAIFLVGNIWLEQYSNLNAEIAAGKITEHLEVAQRVEEIHNSTANRMVPSATLDIEAIAKETKGAVKNLDDFQGNLLKGQVCAEFQGFPSITGFVPRHKDLAISEETKANAECLLRYMVRDGLLIPLEQCLDNFEFREVECASDEEMSFAFRPKSLAAVDTLALFAEFLERVGDKVVLTGRTAFTICQLLARANNNTKKIFSSPTTPLLLYDALQRGKEAYYEVQASGIWSSENKEEFLTAMSDRLEATREEEVWKTIVANRGAVDSLQSRLQSELGSESTLSDPLLFYQTALDLHQSAIKAGYTCKRTYKETNVKPYEAFTSAAFGGECEARLVIVGDQEWTFKTPKEVMLGGQSHFQIPILQLAQLKSNGMAQNKFSNAGPARYVDLRNGEEVFRCFREVQPGEDIGGTQFYEYEGKRYVLKDGYRAWYMNLPESLWMISMAEFVAYYDRSDENEATINDLIKGNGYLSTDKRNEQERLLKSDDEASQRDTLLPNKILLKDGKTTFRKRAIPAPLQSIAVGLENKYNETALLSPWTPNEQQIQHKEACFHITDVWRYHCADCGLCRKKEDSAAEVGDDTGDDRGDAGDIMDSQQLMPDFDLGESQLSEPPMSQEQGLGADFSLGPTPSVPDSNSKADFNLGSAPSIPESNPQASSGDSQACELCKKGETHACPLDPSQPSVITARQREAPRTPAKRKRTGLSTPASKSRRVSQASDSQMRAELENLQRDNEEFLAEFPNATQRTSEQRDFIKSIKNRINRLKHRIADNTLFEKKQKKSGKERIKEYREKLSTLEKKSEREALVERVRELREKQSDSEKKAARDAAAERMKRLRAKRASLQTVDAVHNWESPQSVHSVHHPKGRQRGYKLLKAL